MKSSILILAALLTCAYGSGLYGLLSPYRHQYASYQSSYHGYPANDYRAPLVIRHPPSYDNYHSGYPGYGNGYGYGEGNYGRYGYGSAYDYRPYGYSSRYFNQYVPHRSSYGSPYSHTYNPNYGY
ncbi:uncharacterized protein LOC141854133 [Brevipalpus obovatus]|uniref:uncharacterized protein LOC141854133 n=1 Tax=Brevipalpus obovatus TaxID=246614 RepID=UPI003D9EB2E8